MVGASLAYCAALAALALSPWFWLALLAAAGTGLFDTLQATPRNALIQAITLDEIRGRVESFRQMLTGGVPALGQVYMGGAASLVGPSPWSPAPRRVPPPSLGSSPRGQTSARATLASIRTARPPIERAPPPRETSESVEIRTSAPGRKASAVVAMSSAFGRRIDRRHVGVQRDRDLVRGPVTKWGHPAKLLSECGTDKTRG